MTHSALLEAGACLRPVRTLIHSCFATRGAASTNFPLSALDGLAKNRFVHRQTVSEAERRWLMQTRPAEALHWNLLTDLKAQLLPYAA